MFVWVIVSFCFRMTKNVSSRVIQGLGNAELRAEKFHTDTVMLKSQSMSTYKHIHIHSLGTFRFR